MGVRPETAAEDAAVIRVLGRNREPRGPDAAFIFRDEHLDVAPDGYARAQRTIRKSSAQPLHDDLRVVIGREREVRANMS